jgi:hypothetical protein
MTTNGHNDAPNTDVNPQALQQGHEPDKVNARALLYVPAVLVVCFIITFVIVTKIVDYVRAPSTEKPDNALAAKHNDAPINDRLGRISSEFDEAKKPLYKQPRLEGAKQLDTNEVPFVKSYEPTKEGNSPQYHADDMRPSSAHGKELGLQDYKWVDEKHGIVRLPIEAAMKAVLEAKNPSDPSKRLIVVQEKDGKPVELSSLLRPIGKPSNPLWGAKSIEPPKEPSHQSPKDGHP